MSINNPLVVINSLTANITIAENTIEDLRATIKGINGRMLDKDNRIAELKAEINKFNEVPQDEPLVQQLDRQLERANAKIADLKNQLSAERGASAYLRSYFIKFNQDAIDHLCGCIVGMVKTGDKPLPLRFKSGILALSPINFAFNGGKIAVKTEEAMAKIRALESGYNE